MIGAGARLETYWWCSSSWQQKQMTSKTEIEWRCNSITHRMEEGASSFPAPMMTCKALVWSVYNIEIERWFSIEWSITIWHQRQCIISSSTILIRKFEIIKIISADSIKSWSLKKNTQKRSETVTITFIFDKILSHGKFLKTIVQIRIF